MSGMKNARMLPIIIYFYLRGINVLPLLSEISSTNHTNNKSQSPTNALVVPFFPLLRRKQCPGIVAPKESHEMGNLHNVRL